MKKGTILWGLLALFGLLSAIFSNAIPAAADGNNRLAPSFNYTLQGDVVAAGIGLRGTGTGDIVLSDIPSGAEIVRAFLYWATLGNANTFTSPTLNGEQVQDDLIGRSGDTCWGAQHNFVYRADVTGLVSGNGTYTIAGLPSSLTQGNDSQGASLVVVYRDAGQPARSIVINDGAVSLDFTTNTYTDTISGFIPAGPGNDARVTYLIGDGQEMWEAGNVNFNGTPIAAGIFSGVDGDFWGTHTFEVADLVSSSPATTTINNEVPDSPDSPDCLLWAATIFSVVTEPEESQDQMVEFLHQRIFGDVTASGVGLRGAGEGEITLTGVPSGASVHQAFLYWATIGNSSQYLSPSFAGEQVDGRLIGISDDTCWGAQHNYVYRANVTGLVPGNGSYTISGLPDSLAAGNDSQGASLVVVYTHNIFRPFRTIIINNGAVTLDLEDHSFTDTLGEFTADQPMAAAHITYLVGDGQARWDTGNVTFEGTSIANNVFTGVDGDYWGTLTFDVTGLVTEPEVTTTLNNNDPGNPDSPDCLLWAATVFSVESEAPDNFLFFPLIVHEAELLP
jgi:hypothetical protein